MQHLGLVVGKLSGRVALSLFSFTLSLCPTWWGVVGFLQSCFTVFLEHLSLPPLAIKNITNVGLGWEEVGLPRLRQSLCFKYHHYCTQGGALGKSPCLRLPPSPCDSSIFLGPPSPSSPQLFCFLLHFNLIAFSDLVFFFFTPLH